MFMRLFGKTEKEKVTGLIGFCMIVILFVISFLVVYQPAFGNQVSERTLNMDIVSVLASLFTLLVGYIAGSLESAKEDDKGATG